MKDEVEQRFTEKQMRNAIYYAIIGDCERIEDNGSYKGNGHHLAQLLTECIIKKLTERI